jgi:hypothetical protein
VEVAVINRIVAIISVAAVTIISIARLLIVSNYQTPIAIAVAASNGTVSTLTGTLVPLVPLFLPLTTQLLALCALGAMLFGLRVRFHLFFATATAFFSTIFVTPTKLSLDEALRSASGLEVWALVLFFSIFVVGIFVNLRVHVMEFTTGSAFVVILMVITVTVPTVASYSFPSLSEIRHIPDVLHRVWLPAEIIGMNDGSEYVGYVLKTDGVWTTILWDSDRSIVIVRSQNITSRTICRIGSPDGLPLISVQSAEVPKIEPCDFPVVRPVQIPPLRIRLP